MNLGTVDWMFVAALCAPVLLVVLAAVGIARFAAWWKSPFSFPYMRVTFDVSRKRNVDMAEQIELWLLDESNRAAVERHRAAIEEWKRAGEQYIETHALKKRRREQYLRAIDDEHAYVFATTRDKTRYRQSNYVRHSYTVTETDQTCRMGYGQLSEMMRRLAAIGFETTSAKYHAKEQRRLMTPKLRQQIKERDNYTCRVCGKYMPDGVGLHIDHIIPVAQGGKSVPSNLQVLCSKCNGSKGNRIPPPAWAAAIQPGECD